MRKNGSEPLVHALARIGPSGWVSIVKPIELTNPLAHSQYARKRKGIKYAP